MHYIDFSDLCRLFRRSNNSIPTAVDKGTSEALPLLDSHPLFHHATICGVVPQDTDIHRRQEKRAF